MPSKVTEVTYDAQNDEHIHVLDALETWSWALVYPSGLQINEIHTSLPFHEQQPGAVILAAIDPSGQPRAAIDLRYNEHEWTPIFYHQYEAGITVRRDQPRWKEIQDLKSVRRLSGTIYGRIRLVQGVTDHDEPQVACQLWAVVGGIFQDCPPDMLNTSAIRQCFPLKEV